MTTKAKILIGIFHADRLPWSQIVTDGQIPTWVSKTHEMAEVCYCTGSKNFPIFNWLDSYLEKMRWNLGARVSNIRNYINFLCAKPFTRLQPRMIPEVQTLNGYHRKILRTNFPDLYITTRWRRVALMKYFLDNTKFEYLVTTTSSSYINIDALLRELDTHDSEIVYGGAVQYPGTHAEYPMGSFIVLSRKAVKQLLNNLSNYPVEMLDDIGMGKAACRLGMKPISFKSKVITQEYEITQLSMEELAAISHYKLKSGELNNRKDVGLFHLLHKRIIEKIEKPTL